MKTINIDELTDKATEDLKDIEYAVVPGKIQKVERASKVFLINTYYTDYKSKKILHGHNEFKPVQHETTLRMLGKNSGVFFKQCSIIEINKEYKTNDTYFQVNEDFEITQYSNKEVQERIEKELKDKLCIGQINDEKLIPIYNPEWKIKNKSKEITPTDKGSTKVLHLKLDTEYTACLEAIKAYFTLSIKNNRVELSNIHL